MSLIPPWLLVYMTSKIPLWFRKRVCVCVCVCNFSDAVIMRKLCVVTLWCTVSLICRSHWLSCSICQWG